MRKPLVETGRGRLRQEAAFGSLGITGAVSSFSPGGGSGERMKTAPRTQDGHSRARQN